MFIKPHACVPKNDNNLLYKQKLVETFKENGCEVIKEGKISSSVIEKRKLIDAHYYAIASKATLLKPSELNVPEDVFQKTFGILHFGTIYICAFSMEFSTKRNPEQTYYLATKSSQCEAGCTVTKWR